ncbi:MAG: peroxiredoxin family protein [Vicinamibacterales bacterium]|jgi:peroxiredoxin|nr:peroxiredoxin family protein [Vicinamibacterales bacterium]
MKSLGLLAAAVVAFALPSTPGEPVSTPGPDPVPITSGANLFAGGAVEPPTTSVSVGDRAPDFSFSAPGGNVSLHDLTAQGAVLLVFGADESTLRSLDRERDELLDLGVLTVAVLPAKGSQLQSMTRRLGLRYTVVPDPRRVVAAQYDVVDERRQAAVPAWFVLDRGRRVRALQRQGLPDGGFARIAASALLIPARDVPLPTGSR